MTEIGTQLNITIKIFIIQVVMVRAMRIFFFYSFPTPAPRYLLLCSDHTLKRTVLQLPTLQKFIISFSAIIDQESEILFNSDRK